jgi:hypothetical protein
MDPMGLGLRTERRFWSCEQGHQNDFDYRGNDEVGFVFLSCVLTSRVIFQCNNATMNDVD